MKTDENISELISSLKARNNSAYKFFESLCRESGNQELTSDAKQRLSSCYAITQYANFTDEEEKLLSDIIESLKE